MNTRPKVHSTSHHAFQRIFLSYSTAQFDLGLGASCDEVNESRYCSQGLVCHQCPRENKYTCVACTYYFGYLIEQFHFIILSINLIGTRKNINLKQYKFVKGYLENNKWLSSSWEKQDILVV